MKFYERCKVLTALLQLKGRPSVNVHLIDVMSLILCEFVDRAHASTSSDLFTNLLPLSLSRNFVPLARTEHPLPPRVDFKIKASKVVVRPDLECTSRNLIAEEVFRDTCETSIGILSLKS